MKMISEVIARRGLLYELVLKELRLRYRRPVLGFVWAFLSPLSMAGILYAVFSLLLSVSIIEGPYWPYLAIGVFVWRVTADSILYATTSFVDNRHLLKETMAPHLFIPLSIVLSQFVIFVPALAILLVICAMTLKSIPVFILFLPAVLMCHFFLTFALSVIGAVLFVRYRDVKYIAEAGLTALFYATPVFYSITLVTTAAWPAALSLYESNPFVGIVTMYRHVLMNGFAFLPGDPHGHMFVIVMAIVWCIVSSVSAVYLLYSKKKMIAEHLSY